MTSLDIRDYYGTIMIVNAMIISGSVQQAKPPKLDEQKARTPVIIGPSDVPKWRKDSPSA